jgi:hypothetical protein
MIRQIEHTLLAAASCQFAELPMSMVPAKNSCGRAVGSGPGASTISGIGGGLTRCGECWGFEVGPMVTTEGTLVSDQGVGYKCPEATLWAIVGDWFHWISLVVGHNSAQLGIIVPRSLGVWG